MKILIITALAAALMAFSTTADARDRCGSFHHHHHYGHHCYGFFSVGIGWPSYCVTWPRYYYYDYTPRYYVTSRYVATPSCGLAAEVQMALARRGYYCGAIDGIIGPQSRSAICRYQARRGLPVTGRIDGCLLDALGLD